MAKEFCDLPRAAQAGIRCHDIDFQAWVGVPAEFQGDHGIEHAANIVRGRCAVSSRSELSTNELASRYWDSLIAEFDARKSF